MQITLKILQRKLTRIATTVGGGSTQMWQECDIAQTAQARVRWEWLLFENVKGKLNVTFARNSNQRFLINDRPPPYVDEDAHNAQPAQQRFVAARVKVLVTYFMRPMAAYPVQLNVR